MTLSALRLDASTAGALSRPVARHRCRVRPLRAVRRHAAWLLLAGWIVLPLLPVIGLGLSVLLGVGLF